MQQHNEQMQECRPRSALRSHSRSPTLRTVRFVRRAVSEDAPKRASSPISDQDDRVDIVAIESDAHLTQPPARRAERHPRWRPSPRSMPLSPAAGRHTSNLELSSDESTAAVAIKSASAPTAASNDGARRRPSRTVVVPPATGSLAAVQRETIGQRQLAMLSIVFTALNALLLLLGVGILIIILSNGRASSDVQSHSPNQRTLPAPMPTPPSSLNNTTDASTTMLPANKSDFENGTYGNNP